MANFILEHDNENVGDYNKELQEQMTILPNTLATREEIRVIVIINTRERGRLNISTYLIYEERES